MALIDMSLADGQLSTSKATIYTVPAGASTFPRFLSLFNTNAADQTIVVYLKRSGSTSRKLRRYVLAQNESGTVFDGSDSLALSPGDVIEAETTTATAVDYVLAGAVRAV